MQKWKNAKENRTERKEAFLVHYIICVLVWARYGLHSITWTQIGFHYGASLGTDAT